MRGRVWMAACCSLVAATLVAAPAQAQEPEPISVVEVEVSGQAELDRLVRVASDVTEHVEERDGQTVVQIVTTESELGVLRAHGFEIGRTVDTQAQMEARQRQHLRELRAGPEQEQPGINQDVAVGEQLVVMRADYFTNLNTNRVLSVEAKSDAGASDTLTVRWDSGPGTELGSGGTITLTPFVDTDVTTDTYLYHRRQWSVATRPDKVEVTSSATGEVLVGSVRDWAPPLEDGGDPLQVGFVTGYLDPTQAYDRIKALADEYPRLAEIIELPYLTNGYRRFSQATIGSGTPSPNPPQWQPCQSTPADWNRFLVLESRNYGSEGGDNVRVTVRDPGAANAPLRVTANRDTLVVDLATDATGATTSTVAEVAEAINAKPGAAARAFTYRCAAGDQPLAPTAETRLEDNLNAPAHVSRKPHPMYAIRIGRDRSGDKVGVYAYAQEHAREWVGPWVAVETAERLLRNYATNASVRRILNNVDVFILPSANPDGGHYSFYDFTGQRKNMFNYCGPDERDPGLRNAWGVDLNRNYSVGSVFDGYVGATYTNCRSGNFSGPFEFSEPETRNVEWIADSFPNIRFSMNIHSSGNFFMWPPGAYTPERVTLPRPTLGQESYFWGAAGRVVSAIRSWRDLTVTPRQTGPVADVLYSAAGNSGDEFWYENGIYGWDFEIGTSFQPPLAEAFNVGMEFSNGLVELFNVARDFAADGRAPTSWIEQRATADGKVRIRFFADEAATVLYRLDGRRPTYGTSQMYLQAGDREGGESITLDRTTTVTWFAVDAAGNVERNYKPDDGSVSNRYRRQVVEVPAAEAPLTEAPPAAARPAATTVSATVAPATAAETAAKAKVKRKKLTCKQAKRRAAKSKAAKRKLASCRKAQRDRRSYRRRAQR